MKKRLLSILFTLALCLALLSVTALAADPVDYGVTVNGVAVTSDNVGDVLGDGKVSYDEDTNTLTINGYLNGGTNISGNGATDIVINGVDNSSAASGLTVTDAKNVTVTANSGGPAINGAADITCSGDVELTNSAGIAVSGWLTVNGAQKVKVTANSFSCAINNGADINCSGNVEITNDSLSKSASAVQGSLTVNHAQGVTVTANGGQAVSQTLTVNGAQNVTVTANSDTAAAVNDASITCSGDVEITNSGTGSAVNGTLTVNGAQDVTVTANSGNPAITNDVSITCSGDVEITNSGNGMAVYGMLTVKDAQNVTVSANGVSPTINGAADITCSGDVTLTNMGHGQVAAKTLTVNGAQNVTVSANSISPAISFPTDITCSGDVEITNSLGIALNSFLTVNGAKDVTISAGETAIYDVNMAVYKATISCSGDVSITNSHGQININGLTVTGARNVTVSANSNRSAAIYGDVSITCSGTVQLVNEGESKVIFTTLTFNQLNGDAYTVSSGSSLSDLTILRAQEAGTTFGPQAIDAQAVQIVPAHTPGEWEHNRTQHWQVCTACGAELDPADHTFSGRTCTVCGYTKPSSSGSSTPTYTPTVTQPENGSVTVSPKSPKKGNTVTITPKPEAGYTVEQILVTDKNGDPVEVINNGDGTYSFTQPAGKVTVEVTFMEDNAMLNFFVDVFPGDYSYDAVLWAAENGITGGVDDTHFAPNAPCTRAQIVTFLWRAAGCPEPETLSSFADVPADSYYAKAVAWAVENGITTGTSDTAFSPDATCTRAQAMTFIYRSVQAQGGGLEGEWMFQNPFSDVNLESYYGEAVMWAVANGVTSGTSDTAFSPSSDCTRAQIVTFLYRCLGGK